MPVALPDRPKELAWFLRQWLHQGMRDDVPEVEQGEGQGEIMTIEYVCGHTVESAVWKKKEDIPAYLEKRKWRLCPACKERRAKAQKRLLERQSLHRMQVFQLQFVAQCLRAAKHIQLNPVEARYARRLMADMDRRFPITLPTDCREQGPDMGD